MRIPETSFIEHNASARWPIKQTHDVQHCGFFLVSVKFSLVSFSSLTISCHLFHLYQLWIWLLSPGRAHVSGSFSPTSESHVSPAADSRGGEVCFPVGASLHYCGGNAAHAQSGVFFYSFSLSEFVRGTAACCLMEGVDLLQACWCFSAAQLANVSPTFALNISIDVSKGYY